MKKTNADPQIVERKFIHFIIVCICGNYEIQNAPYDKFRIEDWTCPDCGTEYKMEEIRDVNKCDLQFRNNKWMSSITVEYDDSHHNHIKKTTDFLMANFELKAFRDLHPELTTPQDHIKYINEQLRLRGEEEIF